MTVLKIVLLCIAASILYGWAHDLVTANVCVEYFTVGHPDVFGTKNPWLLAFGWGALATWWVGLFLGVLLAGSAQVGELPAVTWRELVKPIAIMLLTNYLLAFAAGLIVYFASDIGFGLQPLHLSAETDHRFFAVFVVHNASYILGAIGGLVLCIWTIRERLRRNARNSVGPDTSIGT